MSRKALDPPFRNLPAAAAIFRNSRGHLLCSPLRLSPCRRARHRHRHRHHSQKQRHLHSLASLLPLEHIIPRLCPPPPIFHSSHPHSPSRTSQHSFTYPPPTRGTVSSLEPYTYQSNTRLLYIVYLVFVLYPTAVLINPPRPHPTFFTHSQLSVLYIKDTLPTPFLLGTAKAHLCFFYTKT